uniref:Uncharacterized protein n=1 Tax=Globodera rostochiensis TaxID=31243 RepID=A0A914GW96_GLORO
MDLVHSSPLPIFNSNTATTSAHSKLVYAVRRNNSPTMSDLSAYMSSPSAAAPATGGAQSAYMSSPGGEAPAAGGEAPAASGGGGAQSAYMSSPTYNQPEPTPRKMFLLKFGVFSPILFCSALLFVAGSDVGSSADLELSIGSSAATKLVQGALDGALRSPRFIELELASRNSPRHAVAHVYSLNRVNVGALEVRFNDSQIRVEARRVLLNSSSLINMTTLPLLLDGKRVILNAVVETAVLRLDISNANTLRVRECDLDYSDVELYLQNSFFLNMALSAVRGTMSASMLRETVCSMLYGTVLNLAEKYLFEFPFAQLIPPEFVPYLRSSSVRLRSRLQSVIADRNQIALTLDIEWADKNSARHQPALLASTGTNSVDEDEVEGTTPFGDIGSGGWTVVEWSPAAADLLQPTNGKVGSNDSGGVMSERLLVWINETVLNELLDQFQWDFKIIEEKIPLNSSKLPYETRDFFANICPQCIFIFNVSADGLPSVTIEDSSILVKIHNRIAAEVENPTIGESGQKKTAIDLTLSLTVQLVPQVRDGIFHTQLNLKERKIDMKNKTAFPKQLKPVVEELLQDMIKDDVWPAVKRGIEPLIYVKGVELPPHCGIDPKSAQLHFGHRKFGASATLNIKEISLNQCVDQLKSKLPDPSKLFMINATSF